MLGKSVIVVPATAFGYWTVPSVAALQPRATLNRLGHQFHPVAAAAKCLTAGGEILQLGQILETG